MIHFLFPPFKKKKKKKAPLKIRNQDKCVPKKENEGKPHPNCCTQEASSIFESDADYETVNFKHDDTIA